MCTLMRVRPPVMRCSALTGLTWSALFSMVSSMSCDEKWVEREAFARILDADRGLAVLVGGPRGVISGEGRRTRRRKETR